MRVIDLSKDTDNQQDWNCDAVQLSKWTTGAGKSVLPS